MVLRNLRGRPIQAPAAFIHPCQPIVTKQQINGADWSKSYPLIAVEAAAEFR